MIIQNIQHKITSNDYDQEIIKKCYGHAIKLLAHKDYSQFKLHNKLILKGYPLDLVENLIEVLIEEKFLREDYYKEARIKGLLNKGYHPNVIQQKMNLEQCPVTSYEISDVMSEIHITHESLLEDVINKKLRLIDSLGGGEMDYYKKRDKVMKFIMSKGHCPDLAKEILNNLL